MNRKYLSFDIELYNELPEDRTQQDLKTMIPSVGGWATGIMNTKFYEGDPYMTKEMAKRLVIDMLKEYHMGFIPFTWNGLSFDFALLAHYSGMVEECAKLALNGVDGMFLVVAQKGYYLSLKKVLEGLGLVSKLDTVKLKDGTYFSMDGAKAPDLWRRKEFWAVKEYLKVDIIQPLKLAYLIDGLEMIQWTSDKAKKNTLPTKMLTVKEAMLLPKPDVSWMSNPVKREDFYSWIPKEILEAEGIVNV